MEEIKRKDIRRIPPTATKPPKQKKIEKKKANQADQKH